MNDANDAGTLAPCPFCKKPPGQRVGPPAMVRCITDGCEGKSLGAETPNEWNERAVHSTPNAPVALATMVFKAVKFADRAAGEGILFDDLDPADIFSDYVTAIGTDTWDGLPEVARDAILAVRLDEAAIRKDEREPTSEMLLAGARSIGNSMGADNFMVRAKSCWDAMQAARMGTMEPRPAIRNGGKQP